MVQVEDGELDEYDSEAIHDHSTNIDLHWIR